MSTSGQATPTSVQWFNAAKPLAESGNVVAQAHLGTMYSYGDGVPQDFVEAVKWFRLAAEQGHPGARCSLGVSYAKGEGVPQDYSEAVKWFRLAAEQGDAHAQHNLGVAYEYGTGVPQDHATAYTWHSVSSVGGNKNYEKHRDDTAGKLTPEQLLQAQKRANGLFEQYGSGK